MTKRHAGFVRVTHWLTALAFAALLVSGVEVLFSHLRFYWGETGNTKYVNRLVLTDSLDEAR